MDYMLLSLCTRVYPTISPGRIPYVCRELCLHRETTSLNLAKLRGVTFVNQYVVIKYLGKGANGRVFLCLDMCDNRLYAVKVSPYCLV